MSRNQSVGETTDVKPAAQRPQRRKTSTQTTDFVYETGHEEPIELPDLTGEKRLATMPSGEDPTERMKGGLNQPIRNENMSYKVKHGKSKPKASKKSYISGDEKLEDRVTLRDEVLIDQQEASPARATRSSGRLKSATSSLGSANFSESFDLTPSDTTLTRSMARGEKFPPTMAQLEDESYEPSAETDALSAAFTPENESLDEVESEREVDDDEYLGEMDEDTDDDEDINISKSKRVKNRKNKGARKAQPRRVHNPMRTPGGAKKIPQPAAKQADDQGVKISPIPDPALNKNETLAQHTEPARQRGLDQKILSSHSPGTGLSSQGRQPLVMGDEIPLTKDLTYAEIRGYSALSRENGRVAGTRAISSTSSEVERNIQVESGDRILGVSDYRPQLPGATTQESLPYSLADIQTAFENAKWGGALSQGADLPAIGISEGTILEKDGPFPTRSNGQNDNKVYPFSQMLDSVDSKLPSLSVRGMDSANNPTLSSNGSALSSRDSRGGFNPEAFPLVPKRQGTTYVANPLLAPDPSMQKSLSNSILQRERHHSTLMMAPVEGTHRTSCHKCGNIRKNNVFCVNCPHIFCARCAEKTVAEWGPDVFVDGCPVCRRECCCALARDETECVALTHCYKKCPATKNAGMTGASETLGGASLSANQRKPVMDLAEAAAIVEKFIKVDTSQRHGSSRSGRKSQGKSGRLGSRSRASSSSQKVSGYSTRRAATAQSVPLSTTPIIAQSEQNIYNISKLHPSIQAIYLNQALNNSVFQRQGLGLDQVLAAPQIATSFPPNVPATDAMQSLKPVQNVGLPGIQTVPVPTSEYGSSTERAGYYAPTGIVEDAPKVPIVDKEGIVHPYPNAIRPVTPSGSPVTSVLGTSTSNEPMKTFESEGRKLQQLNAPGSLLTIKNEQGVEYPGVSSSVSQMDLMSSMHHSTDVNGAMRMKEPSPYDIGQTSQRVIPSLMSAAQRNTKPHFFPPEYSSEDRPPKLFLGEPTENGYSQPSTDSDFSLYRQYVQYPMENEVSLSSIEKISQYPLPLVSEGSDLGRSPTFPFRSDYPMRPLSHDLRIHDTKEENGANGTFGTLGSQSWNDVPPLSTTIDDRGSDSSEGPSSQPLSSRLIGVDTYGHPDVATSPPLSATGYPDTAHSLSRAITISTPYRGTSSIFTTNISASDEKPSKGDLSIGPRRYYATKKELSKEIDAAPTLFPQDDKGLQRNGEKEIDSDSINYKEIVSDVLKRRDMGQLIESLPTLDSKEFYPGSSKFDEEGPSIWRRRFDEEPIDVIKTPLSVGFPRSEKQDSDIIPSGTMLHASPFTHKITVPPITEPDDDMDLKILGKRYRNRMTPNMASMVHDDTASNGAFASSHGFNLSKLGLPFEYHASKLDRVKPRSAILPIDETNNVETPISILPERIRAELGSETGDTSLSVITPTQNDKESARDEEKDASGTWKTKRRSSGLLIDDLISSPLVPLDPSFLDLPLTQEDEKGVSKVNYVRTSGGRLVSGDFNQAFTIERPETIVELEGTVRQAKQEIEGLGDVTHEADGEATTLLARTQKEEHMKVTSIPPNITLSNLNFIPTADQVEVKADVIRSFESRDQLSIDSKAKLDGDKQLTAVRDQVRHACSPRSRPLCEAELEMSSKSPRTLGRLMCMRVRNSLFVNGENALSTASPLSKSIRRNSSSSRVFNFDSDHTNNLLNSPRSGMIVQSPSEEDNERVERTSRTPTPLGTPTIRQQYIMQQRLYQAMGNASYPKSSIMMEEIKNDLISREGKSKVGEDKKASVSELNPPFHIDEPVESIPTPIEGMEEDKEPQAASEPKLTQAPGRDDEPNEGRQIEVPQLASQDLSSFARQNPPTQSAGDVIDEDVHSESYLLWKSKDLVDRNGSDEHESSSTQVVVPEYVELIQPSEVDISQKGMTVKGESITMVSSADFVEQSEGAFRRGASEGKVEQTHVETIPVDLSSRQDRPLSNAEAETPSISTPFPIVQRVRGKQFVVTASDAVADNAGGSHATVEHVLSIGPRKLHNREKTGTLMSPIGIDTMEEMDIPQEGALDTVKMNGRGNAHTSNHQVLTSDRESTSEDIGPLSVDHGHEAFVNNDIQSQGIQSTEDGA